MKLPLDEIKSRLNTEKEKIIELEVLTTKQKKTISALCPGVFHLLYFLCKGNSMQRRIKITKLYHYMLKLKEPVNVEFYTPH